MSFHLSAVDVRLDLGNLLWAYLDDGKGGQVGDEFNLNTVIGNNNGNFEWGGSDFSKSAERITFSFEGDDGVPILRAYLRDNDGSLHHRDLNLSERITNENGHFVYTE